MREGDTADWLRGTRLFPVPKSPAENRRKISTFVQDTHNLNIAIFEAVKDCVRRDECRPEPWHQIVSGSSRERVCPNHLRYALDPAENVICNIRRGDARVIPPDVEQVLLRSRRPNDTPRPRHAPCGLAL